MYKEAEPGDGVDMDALEETAWIVYVQPLLRSAATNLGNFRSCALPKCRRAKKCAGRHPIERICTDHWSNFPPCINTTEKQMALVQENRRLYEEALEEMHARGIAFESPT